MKNDSQRKVANRSRRSAAPTGGVIALAAVLGLALSAFGFSEPDVREGRALFYPTVLKDASSPNLLAGAKWRPPSEASEKDSRAAVIKGGPFGADGTAYEVESFRPESAYWRTHVKVQRGRTYLVGAWVKFTNAKVLFWIYGKRPDGKPSDQRLYSLAGFQAYLAPYLSDELKRKFAGGKDGWKLMFRTLEYPDGVANDMVCVAMGIYMATGKLAFSAPFLIDVTDVKDASLTIDIAGAKPVRKLAVEHVGVRDIIWERSFPKPVTDFAEAVPSVTDFRRGMDGRNQIDGHALNIYYVDGTMAKVFAPQENIFKHR